MGLRSKMMSEDEDYYFAPDEVYGMQEEMMEDEVLMNEFRSSIHHSKQLFRVRKLLAKSGEHKSN